ncbi:MAG: iron-containing alcohol dehydrogenase, partial [Limisphaerales bacterium]
DESVKWIEDLCSGINVPKLRRYGVDAESFPLLCERGAKASSMKANPIELTPGELREVLERAQ